VRGDGRVSPRPAARAAKYRWRIARMPHRADRCLRPFLPRLHLRCGL
jgi:hypothetical protein